MFSSGMVCGELFPYYNRSVSLNSKRPVIKYADQIMRIYLGASGTARKNTSGVISGSAVARMGL